MDEQNEINPVVKRELDHDDTSLLEESIIYICLYEATSEKDLEPFKKTETTLDDADFFMTKHQVAFQLLKKVYEKHKAIDYMLFYEEHTKAGDGDLFTASDYTLPPADWPFTSNFLDDHILLLREKRIKREIKYAHEKYQNKEIDRPEFDEKIAEIRKLAITRDLINTMKKEIELYYEEFTKTIDLKEKGGSTLVETGFLTFDRKCGLTRGELVTIAARTGVGKSMFGLNLAIKAAEKDYNVLFLSIEMARNQIQDRIFANQTGELISTFKTASVNVDKFGKMADDVGEKLKNLKAMYTPHITSQDIDLLFREVESVDLLIVDYIQILNDPLKKNETNTMRVGKITRTLKKIAGDYNCCVIGISQVNRETARNKHKTPDLENLRDSGAIEQDSDKVFFLNRKKQEAPKNLTLFVAKNRTGEEAFEVKFEFDAAHARVSETYKFN